MDDQAIISQTKLFVGGLNWKLRGKELREEFSKFGERNYCRTSFVRIYCKNYREYKRKPVFVFRSFA